MARRDLSFAGPLFPAFARLVRTWFRPHVEGLDDVPDDPVLFVGNHSGGVPPYESMVLAAEFFDRHGLDRPLYWLAHSLLMRTPALGDFLLRCGVVPASRGAARAVLDHGGSLVVYPGGEVELHRPWTARDELRFLGRTGFLRTAAETGAPLVPVVTAGGQGTYLPISDGRRLARLLRLDRTLGIKVLPLAVSIPWGLTSGLLPHVPLPAQIRVRVLDPIDVASKFGDDLDSAYDYVTGLMQTHLREMTVRRGVAGRVEEPPPGA